MKKMLILTLLVLAIAAAAFAQGPYSMSIGSGTGSLSFSAIYSTGYISGDDGTFFTGPSSSATTVWNGCFMLTNVDNSANTYWMDKTGFSTHTSRPTDGTIATTASTLSNTGMTFSGLTGITSNLSLALSQPTAGDTAKATWTWVYNNANTSAANLRMIFFLDADLYDAGSTSVGYNQDLVAAVQSSFGSYTTMCQGKNDGTGKVNLDKGIKIDCDNTITRYFGLVSGGPSFWWSNGSTYATKGPEIVFKIDDSYANKIENDADSNNVADAVGDSGMAIQCDFQVPASGSKTIVFTATWGLNEIVSDVNNWNLY